MHSHIELAPMDRIEITTLIDNYTTLLLPDTAMMKRYRWKSGESPLAGHGLSLLIELYGDGAKHSILMDPGYPTPGVLHNWRIFDFDPASVGALFLSHGHLDHYEALVPFLEARSERIPFVLHPYAFDQRIKRSRFTHKGKTIQLPALPARQELKELGADVIATTEPHLLAPGLVSTGQIPRLTSFEGRFEKGRWKADDTWDDQGLVAHLRDAGLVVISGCAHAGIVNTIRQAQAITGEERVHAIIGGFHLPHPTKETLDGTINALRALSPALVVPTHCTGFASQCEFARRMPDSFALNAVGTRIVLPGSE